MRVQAGQIGRSETGADAPAALRAVTVMLWISAGATVLYWTTFFTSGAVQISSEAAYLAFERAFPAADAWLAIAAAISALMLARRDPRAVSVSSLVSVSDSRSCWHCFNLYVVTLDFRGHHPLYLRHIFFFIHLNVENSL